MYPNPFDRKHSTFKQVIDKILSLDQNNIYRKQKRKPTMSINNNSETFVNKNTKNSNSNSKLWKGFSKKNSNPSESPTVIIIK